MCHGYGCKWEYGRDMICAKPRRATCPADDLYDEEQEEMKQSALEAAEEDAWDEQRHAI